MDYPDCSNLELTINVINSKPELFPIYYSFLNRFHPLKRYDDLDEDIRVLIEDRIDENFLTPEEGKINFYDRLQRLPRLVEGKYEVLVPESKIGVAGNEIIAPKTVVTFEHFRTYHNNVRFDESLWKNPIKDSNYSLSLGDIEELINIELVTSDICSTYSTFYSSINLPINFINVHNEFDDFSEQEFKEYLSIRELKLKSAIKQGKKAIDEIDKEDKKFYEKHKNLFDEVSKTQAILIHQRNSSITTLIDNYFSMIYSSPATFQFKKNESFSLTSDKKIFSLVGIKNDREINYADFNNPSRNTSVERIPFNQHFHDEFQANLLNKVIEKTPYELKAIKLLKRANDLINDGYYPEATLRAATALEVVLDGFLLEKGVATKEELSEDHTLKYKMNSLFNQAVCKGKNHGKRFNLFDSRIKKKIVDIRKRPTDGSELEEVPTLHNIRNKETHEGGTEEANSNDYYLARIAVSSYAEAVNYVINKGWDNNSYISLQSEILTWITPYLKDRVQQFPEQQVKHMLERDLRKVIPYLQPIEIEKLNKQVDRTSWAYGLLRNALENLNENNK